MTKKPEGPSQLVQLSRRLRVQGYLGYLIDGSGAAVVFPAHTLIPPSNDPKYHG